MANYFVARTRDCWLRVQLTGGPIASLCFGIRVTAPETTGGREHFTILEGINKGKKASVATNAGQSFLTTNLRHGPAARVQFDRASQSLYFNGRGPFNAFSGGGSSGFTPVPPGRYQLAIPAFPTKQTRTAYTTWTKYHNLWFRIGTNVAGSRFLHPGEISEGCVTVRQFIYDPAASAPPPPGFSDLPQDAKSAPGLLGLPLPAKRAPTIGWDNIFETLILSRLNDQAVGLLTVT
jgi:hypothetical protein